MPGIDNYMFYQMNKNDIIINLGLSDQNDKKVLDFFLFVGPDQELHVNVVERCGVLS